MALIKRLHLFVLEVFLPLLLATFGVCLFILLMQFLWRYVEYMVGKGIEMSVLAEMFFYIALSLVPTTLPLAVLLASLMTFGNLGEHFELLAMKSAGVSLIRVMRPIIVFLLALAGASFVFQNNIVPDTQAKMWTMLLSVKNKSPELEVPEGSFYKGIPGYNVYVKSKDKQTGILRNMMIYDLSKGFENTKVIVADSGSLKMSEDKLNLVLTLWNGESFESFPNREYRRGEKGSTPYGRETFSLKRILMTLDSNFNMEDESIMRNREISRNMTQLVEFVDSMGLKVDSINARREEYFTKRIYADAFRGRETGGEIRSAKSDTFAVGKWDDYFTLKNISDKRGLVERAKGKIESIRNDYNIESIQQADQLRRVRMHEIEIHKRFALSLACIVFFFIGGPLGAIVRKGGIGMPAVLSVILFVSYYTIDIFGLKMARQGIWPVWQGIWLSTFVLAALGIFLTYKAVNDSVVMNPDVWRDFFRRFFGKREVRNYQRREVIISTPDYARDIRKMEDLTHLCRNFMEKRKKWPGYYGFWKNGFWDNELQEIVSLEEDIVDDMRNSTENLILGKLMDYPIIKQGYPDFLDNKIVRHVCCILFPIGFAVYFISMYKRKYILQDVRMIVKVNGDLIKEISKEL